MSRIWRMRGPSFLSLNGGLKGARLRWRGGAAAFMRPFGKAPDLICRRLCGYSGVVYGNWREDGSISCNRGNEIWSLFIAPCKSFPGNKRAFSHNWNVPLPWPPWGIFGHGPEAPCMTLIWTNEKFCSRNIEEIYKKELRFTAFGVIWINAATCHMNLKESWTGRSSL